VLPKAGWSEALVEGFPIAEPLRKITPWNAGSIPVQNRLHEQPTIRRLATDMASARQKILDPIPLVVALMHSGASVSPPQADRL
jgi:hypothetical protein